MSPRTPTKSSPQSLLLKKSPHSNEDPVQAKEIKNEKAIHIPRSWNVQGSLLECAHPALRNLNNDLCKLQPQSLLLLENWKLGLSDPIWKIGLKWQPLSSIL